MEGIMVAKIETGAGAKSVKVWSCQDILAEAKRQLATGGVGTRREIVRTLLGLNRLLAG
jgi:hypothetical protein